MYHCSKTKLCIQRKRTYKNPNSSEIKRENLGAFEAKPRKAIKSIPLLSADLICFVLCKYVPVKPLGITEASKAQGRVLLATGTTGKRPVVLYITACSRRSRSTTPRSQVLEGAGANPLMLVHVWCPTEVPPRGTGEDECYKVREKIVPGEMRLF